ncbi:MAG: hypothetical protein PHU71_00140 [Candidatus Gracilibacteria bacterium]|nr:hypothetical protein [Candidatus Gracilibacteria bacterium]
MTIKSNIASLHGARDLKRSTLPPISPLIDIDRDVNYWIDLVSDFVSSGDGTAKGAPRGRDEMDLCLRRAEGNLALGKNIALEEKQELLEKIRELRGKVLATTIPDLQKR